MDQDPNEIYEDGLEAAKERERYDRERSEILDVLAATDPPGDGWRWNNCSGRWVWVDSGSGPGYQKRLPD